MNATSRASVSGPLAVPLAGDAGALARQLGAPADAAEFALGACAVFNSVAVLDAAALRRMLEMYRDRVLVPVEFPAIRAAFEHASRGETRELVALDRQLTREAALAPFAEASRHVGRRQLGRLRPLRGQRIVQRYLAAIERGEARGWHTVVYGLTLGLFSIPLRQGLAHYAQSTLRGFVEFQAEPLNLDEAEVLEIWEGACRPVQLAVESLAQFHPCGQGCSARR